MANTTTGTITAADSGTTATQVGSQTLVSGSPTAGSSAAAPGSDRASVMVGLSGTWTGSVYLERQVAGGSWTKLPLRQAGVTDSGESSRVYAVGEFEGELPPNSGVRVRGGSDFVGTANVVIVTQPSVQAGGSGASPYFNDAVAATVQQVKATAGVLYGLKLVNTTAAVAYLQIFSLPSAGVTLGTTPPAWVIRLAANESANVPMPTPANLGGTGISIAGTTGAANSTGAAISVSALFS